MRVDAKRAARALGAVPEHGTVLVRSISGPPLPVAQFACLAAQHGAAQAAAFWPAAVGPRLAGAGRWAKTRWGKIQSSRPFTCSPAARNGAQGGAETRDGSDDGALRRLKRNCSRMMRALGVVLLFCCTAQRRRALTDSAERDRAILEEALLHVPQHGWSLQAIIMGVKAQGMSPSAHGMFAR
jgi:hypothetical protein